MRLGRLAEPDDLGRTCEPVERAALELAGLGGRDADATGGLLDGVLALAAGAEAQVDDHALLLRQAIDLAADGRGVAVGDDLLLRGGDADVQQGAEGRLAVL